VERDKMRDLVISGSGSASGGTFDHVKISGTGKIAGDLECSHLKVNGALKVDGNVKAKKVTINGTAEFSGRLDSEEIHIQGTSSSDDLKCKTLKISGAAKVNGCLSVEELKLKGSIDVEKDCEAEVFEASGIFTIGRLLNAGTIDVKLYGTCRAKEIGGEKISVRKGGSRFNRLIKSLFLLADDTLKAEVIEGDDLDLENIKADVVRGNNVIIGEGCEIGLVEYKQNYSGENGAKVTEAKKI
jgi:cytoskeletal protein CcmA (bactofilin family)